MDQYIDLIFSIVLGGGVVIGVAISAGVYALFDNVSIPSDPLTRGLIIGTGVGIITCVGFNQLTKSKK